MEKSEKLRAVFPRRLKSAMFDKGLNCKQLAEQTDIHNNMIGHYVRGKYLPKIEALLALCQALDVSADWLMGREEKG